MLSWHGNGLNILFIHVQRKYAHVVDKWLLFRVCMPINWDKWFLISKESRWLEEVEKSNLWYLAHKCRYISILCPKKKYIFNAVLRRGASRGSATRLRQQVQFKHWNEDHQRLSRTSLMRHTDYRQHRRTLHSQSNRHTVNTTGRSCNKEI